MSKVPPIRDYSRFDPLAYLSEYYSEVGPENDFLLRFYEDSYRVLPQDITVLEVGGGPTIYQLMSASVRAHSITFAEFLPQNRAAVAAWLEGEAPREFSWERFLTRVAELAPNIDVAELREGIREKVTQIVECNLWNEKPIPACTATTFDVVSSAFCAECIDSSPENYRMFLKRLTSYLRPGGTLLLTALENATEYRVGESWFPACPLTLEQLQAEVRALGFSPRDARRVPAEHAQGYDGLLAVRAEAI